MANLKLESQCMLVLSRNTIHCWENEISLVAMSTKLQGLSRLCFWFCIRIGNRCRINLIQISKLRLRICWELGIAKEFGAYPVYILQRKGY